MPMNIRVYLLILLLTSIFLPGCRSDNSDKGTEEMVLRFVMNAKIRSLDPMAMLSVHEAVVGTQMFEGLYQYHYLKRPYELEPLLAESMPEIDSERLTYTIKLKRGVFFQDDRCFPDGIGREVRADDFVYSYKRIANIKNLSPNWPSLKDRIIGLDEFRAYTKKCKNANAVDYSRRIEGLQAIDDYTLVVKLKRPWPQYIYYLVDFPPIAKEAVDFYGMDIISHPIGTGPFKLAKWHRGSYIELVRNPKFRTELYPSEGEDEDAGRGYLDDAGKKLPIADKIIWTIIEEEQPAWFLFLQGKVDASVIPKDNYGEALTVARELTKEMKLRNIHLKSWLVPSTFWLGFNMEDALLGANKPLRQAINHSINRKRFIELFFNGRDIVADGIFVPAMPSYDENIKDKRYSEYSPEKAHELVNSAEQIYGGKLPTLKVSMPGTDTFYRQFGYFIKTSLDAVGISAEIEYMDWPTYLERLTKSDMQIFSSGVKIGTPDAMSYLMMFYSKYKSPGPNNFNYSNPEFDKLFEKVRVMSDSPQRRRLYREMERMVMEDCPAVFMNHRINYILHHDWYKNYKPHAYGYGLAKYRRIDVNKRNAYKKMLKKTR